MSREGLLGAWLLAAFVLCYVPGAGRGFLSDDFRWLVQYEVRSADDVAAAFAKDNGFYRPLVGLSFAAERAVFGLNPRPFGLSNVLIALLMVLALIWFVRSLGLSIAAAIFAAGAWALSPHGVPMAIFWISGRTVLFLCLFSVLAAIASLRHRRLLTFLACFAAMLSKEEAVVLPAILFLVGLARTDETRGTAWRSCLRESAGPLVALGTYLVLRSRTNALLGYALTAFVPVRSSLYACFPAVGVAIAGAVLVDALWRQASEPARWRVVAGLAVVAVAMVPIQWQRSVRWVRPAVVSQTVMTELAAWPHHSPGAAIVLQDARGDSTTLARSFGTLFQDAARLYLDDPSLVGRVLPPVPGEDLNGVVAFGEGRRIERFVFENGHVRPRSTK